jgi:hypothetical protein
VRVAVSIEVSIGILCVRPNAKRYSEGKERMHNCFENAFQLDRAECCMRLSAYSVGPSGAVINDIDRRLSQY